jgi:tetratricopeptide (TPR) repeat protein
MAAQWEDQWELAILASAAAAKHAATFDAIDQFRARAWDAYVRARPREAHRLLDIVIANSPAYGDGWSSLGEIIFHWGPGLGWPLGDARHAFEQLDSVGTPMLPAVVHLARIAAMQGDAAQVDRLVARALTFGPDAAQSLELSALRAFAGSSASSAASVREQDRVVSQIVKTGDVAAQNVVTLIIVCAIDNQRARRAIDALDAPTRSAVTRAAADVMRAGFDVARGRWSGVASVGASAALHPARVVEYRAAFATLPFITLPRDTLEALRAAVKRLAADKLTNPSMYDATLDIYSARRLYLLGRLSARLGDRASAMTYADSIDHVTSSNDVDRGLRTALARVIRATVLHDERKPADALAMLGEAEASPDFVLPGVLSYPVADERFLRAELLHELHRDDEALRWYEGFPDAGGYDLPYLAPVLLRRAEIAQARGSAAEAQRLRARGQALWANSSPEFSR